jgi:hypothetical protein
LKRAQDGGGIYKRFKRRDICWYRGVGWRHRVLMVTKEMASAANELNALRDDAADGVALLGNPMSALRDRSG